MSCQLKFWPFVICQETPSRPSGKRQLSTVNSENGGSDKGHISKGFQTSEDYRGPNGASILFTND